MKYCTIVFHDKVRAVGKHKIETIFFWLDILYPVCIYGLFYVVKKDYNFIADPYLEQFYPRKPGTISGVNSNKTVPNLFEACEFVSFEKMSVHYIFNITKTTFCWVLAISILLNSLNILEAFFYSNIFRTMNR